ncbi:8508_t:CDS:2, partial [Entrophospora sp. SA101]
WTASSISSIIGHATPISQKRKAEDYLDEFRIWLNETVRLPEVQGIATYHLQKIYTVGFAAVYAILAPFGIAGIIGGLNRKKALIKGFMIQYWIATIAFVGLSVGLITMAGSSKRDTFIKCKGEFPPNSEEDVRQICINRVLEFENITKIASYVQGGVLVFFGIFVTIFGVREFMDIKMDEETSSLLDRVDFNNKEEIESNTSSMSDHNQLLPPGSALNRNLSNASSAYSSSSSNSNGSINRYPPMTPYSGVPGRNPVPSNYPHPNATNLSRPHHPSNLSRM